MLLTCYKRNLDQYQHFKIKRGSLTKTIHLKDNQNVIYTPKYL